MGTLVGGKYYKNADEAPIERQAVVGSQLQSYSLESQAKRHDMDLIQPYLSDGSVNPDFVRYYPKEAKEYGMQL